MSSALYAAWEEAERLSAEQQQAVFKAALRRGFAPTAIERADLASAREHARACLAALLGQVDHAAAEAQRIRSLLG